eukprot:TRINITY_DN3359_c0_g1_i9.p1 TRINITY_DN3359_c0_g1~~TRINITY_DN3359_c0_g1_i9.p1  ORF type:complete len:157 (+),score=27.55 TRINITY_DN3359_c0_g1_i9:105-575(+)
MELRTNMLKSYVADLESELMTRLTEREKQIYRSRYEDKEQQWKQLVKVHADDVKMPHFSIGEASRFFFKSYSTQHVKKKNDTIFKRSNEKKKRNADEFDADFDLNLRAAVALNSNENTIGEFYEEDNDELSKRQELERKLREKEEKRFKKSKASFL